MTNERAGAIEWDYTRAEIWADGAIHGLGIAASVTGAVVFLAVIAGQAPGGEIAAVAVYLATLLLSIAISAAYNLWPVSPAKWILRRIDHSAIYLLIAGTYTPFMVELGRPFMLAGVWAAASIGVLIKLVWPGRFDRLAIALYLGLGWSGIVIVETLIAVLPARVLWLIVAGGLVYSFGVVFHVAKNLRFQNAIWHGFVLTAASIHYLAVWFSVGT